MINRPQYSKKHLPEILDLAKVHFCRSHCVTIYSYELTYTQLAQIMLCNLCNIWKLLKIG